MALKWAITANFQDYKPVYGIQFEIYTEKKPMNYIQTNAKLDACGQR